jgi:EAL domain-containing protein (putative c-di-GMP-specific phosphodiesterase class I)
VLDKIDRARSVLYDVRSLGVDVAIDDFGSGYSSLNQLLALPVSIVKLDRSLVASLGHSPRHLALVRSIGDLGRTVGHELVAEGVETETQADMLRRMSYACAQGYLFSPPKPLDELLATGAAPAAPAQGELSVLGDSLGRTALI